MCAQESISQQIESKAKSDIAGSRPIIKKVKKIEAGAHGGSWKVAYADFVTAMMALFLLLWLMAALKPQQKEQLAIFFQNTDTKPSEKPRPGAGMPPIMAKDAKTGVPEIKLTRDEQLKYEVALLIKQLITNDQTLLNNSGISSDDQGVLMNVNSMVMFQPGSAQLKPEAYPILDSVIKIMREHKVDLSVRGHTDDEEGGSTLYPSAWELSAARAAATVRYIMSKGDIPITRLQAAGYADARPLVPNSSPVNRAKNRRVEFYYHSPDYTKG